MNKLDLIQKFVNGLLSVCEGQALDIEFESRKNVSIDEYKANDSSKNSIHDRFISSNWWNYL